MAAETSRILLCRPGFERECAAELEVRGANVRDAASGGGLVVASASGALDLRELVFARDGFDGIAFDLGETRDRITPLVALACRFGPVGALWMQHADTSEGRSLGRLGTRIETRLLGALREAGVLRGHEDARLHVLLASGQTGFIGRSGAASGALWSMGIPRLRLPGAPSRSAAKLEEALLWFAATQPGMRLRAGMSAVDLGAAPGGWSWILARRGLRVTAVDHGKLSAGALEAGAVRHVSADAFTFRPPRAVEWMVCDVVDKPARVAELVTRWFESRWCTCAVFNLKLPMKQRSREAGVILDRLRARLAGVRFAARQLYHDREEITVFAARG